MDKGRGYETPRVIFMIIKNAENEAISPLTAFF